MSVGWLSEQIEATEETDKKRRGLSESHHQTTGTRETETHKQPKLSTTRAVGQLFTRTESQVNANGCLKTTVRLSDKRD